MAFQTGTSTDFKDLLADLRTFATANGWVSEAYTTDVDVNDPDTLYLRGPGPAANADVHINIRTFAQSGSGIFGWEIKGALEYNAGLSYDNQPGTGPSVNLLLHNTSITYWFYVSDIRIIVVAKCSTSYLSAYMGFILPFATPTEYPFPLYIAASDQFQTRPFTFDNSGIRACASPGENAGRLRSPGGIWDEVSNHGDDNPGQDIESHLESGYYVMPYFNGGAPSGDVGSVGGTDGKIQEWDIRPPPGATSNRYIIPLHLTGSGYDFGMVGSPEGLFFIPGFGVGAETEFTLGNVRAAQTLTLTANAANGETVTIGGKAYTFQTVLTNVDGNVLIGATAEDSLDNLVAAINKWAGESTLYADATQIHPSVFAADGSGTTVVVTAIEPGTGGNSIATTETMANGSWGAATLAGGTAGDTYTIFPDVRRAGRMDFYCVKKV